MLHISPIGLFIGVFLGEAAQAMVQNADYEIPFLRKQAARYDQQVGLLPRGSGDKGTSAWELVS